MKKFLTTGLPALALLTLGSCASTSHLTTTEDDGVYYSSKDRTTQSATASTGSYAQAGTTAPADQGTDEATNPEYRSGSGSGSSGSGSRSEYYEDDYGYAARIRRFHQPVYRGFSYGYYDVVAVDPFWYGGYSPFGYSSYYDPFYSPYGYGGSLITINIGFGRPYYNPWGCYGCYGYGGYGRYGGYGYGGYGGYGYGGYYDSYYGGRSNGYGYGGNSGGTATHHGPRRDGAHEANTSGVGPAANNGGRGRGRIDGGVGNPTGGSTAGGVLSGGGSSEAMVVPGRGRGRIVEGNTGSGVSTADAPIRQPLDGRTKPARDLTEQPTKQQEDRVDQLSGAADQPRLDTNPSRGRWRTVDNGGRPGTDTNPSAPRDYSQPQRGRYRDAQPAERPQYSGATEQPRERPVRQRVLSNDHSQPDNVSEQPTRQRSYSEPSRSYSPPANSGGGNRGGSGNSDGGGGRGRGRME